jgi:hypothetical protein
MSGNGVVVPANSVHSSSGPCRAASHFTIAGGGSGSLDEFDRLQPIGTQTAITKAMTPVRVRCDTINSGFLEARSTN